MRKLIADDAVEETTDPFNDEYPSVEENLDVKDNFTLEGNWSFPALYKKDSHDKILKWHIGFNSIVSTLIWISGRLDTGNFQLHKENIHPNKLLKSIQSKAYKNAKTKYDNKLKEGYTPDPTTQTALIEIPLPML